MDISPFKCDIDELIDEFAKSESTSFADMKRIWLSRNFSFIYEARPIAKLNFFMQSLFAHSIGHMVSTGSLSHKLGGLYCLYCLYETQPFKHPFKIYLSIGELRELKTLLINAKENGINVASALVEKMLQKKVLLLGFVDINESRVQKRMNGLTDVQNAQVHVAYKMLLDNTRIEHFLHLDLGMELDVQGLKKMSTEYAKAKEVAIEGVREVVDVKNIHHIAKNERLIGDVIEKISEDWNVQKENFCKQTGFSRPKQKHGDDEAFGKELDMILSDT